MATLYEIDRALRDVIEQGFEVNPETGEVLHDATDLRDLELARNDKLEGCAVWMKEQRALAKSIRDEEKALAERRRAIENRLELMESYVTDSLRAMPGMRFETARASLGVRKSTRVIVDAPEMLPEGFAEVVTSIKPDRAAIGRALKAGETVPGSHSEAHLNLQVK